MKITKDRIETLWMIILIILNGVMWTAVGYKIGEKKWMEQVCPHCQNRISTEPTEHGG